MIGEPPSGMSAEELRLWLLGRIVLEMAKHVQATFPLPPALVVALAELKQRHPMSEGKRTPGPYWNDMHTLYRGRLYTISSSEEIAEIVREADLSECSEIADLLNKGTHYDGMLAALKDLYDAVAFPRQGGCVGTMKAAAAAIAKAEGRGDDRPR